MSRSLKKALFLLIAAASVLSSNIEPFDWLEAKRLILTNDIAAIADIRAYIHDRPSFFLESLSFEEWEALKLCELGEPYLKDLQQDELCSLSPRVGKYLLGCIPHFEETLIFPQIMISEIFTALSAAPIQPIEFYHQIPLSWIEQCPLEFLIAAQNAGSSRFKHLLPDQYKVLFQNLSPENCAHIDIYMLDKLNSSVFDLISVQCLASIRFSNELYLSHGKKLPFALRTYLESENTFWRSARFFDENTTDIAVKRFSFRPSWFILERGHDFLFAVANYHPQEWPNVVGEMVQVEVDLCRSFWLNLPLAIFPYAKPNIKFNFTFEIWDVQQLKNVQNLLSFFPVNVDTNLSSLNSIIRILNTAWTQLMQNNIRDVHPLNSIPLELLRKLATTTNILTLDKEMISEMESRRLFLIDAQNYCYLDFFVPMTDYPFLKSVVYQQRKRIDEGYKVNSNHSLYIYSIFSSKKQSLPDNNKIRRFWEKKVRSENVMRCLNISLIKHQATVNYYLLLFLPLLNEYLETISLLAGHRFDPAMNLRNLIYNRFCLMEESTRKDLMKIKGFTRSALSVFVSDVSIFHQLMPLPANLVPYPEVPKQDIIDMKQHILAFIDFYNTLTTANSGSFDKYSFLLNAVRMYNPTAIMSYLLNEGFLEYYEDGFIRFAFGLDKSVAVVMGVMFGVILLGGNSIHSSPFDYRFFKIASGISREENLFEYFDAVYMDKLAEFESFLAVNGREEYCECFEFKDIESLVPRTLVNDPRYFPEELIDEKPINCLTLERFKSEYMPAFRKKYLDFFRNAIEGFRLGLSRVMTPSVLFTVDYTIISSVFRYTSLFDSEYLLSNCEFDPIFVTQLIDGLDNKKHEASAVIAALLKSLSPIQLSRFFWKVTGSPYPYKHEKFRILFHRHYDFEAEQKAPVVSKATLLNINDLRSIIFRVFVELYGKAHDKIIEINISRPVKLTVASICSRTILIPHQSLVDTILSFLSFLNSPINE